MKCHVVSESCFFSSLETGRRAGRDEEIAVAKRHRGTCPSCPGVYSCFAPTNVAFNIFEAVSITCLNN